MTRRRPPLTQRRAKNTSRLFTSAIVQVTTEANASPIITALTTRSELMNMPQGDRSRGKAAGSMFSPSGVTGCGFASWDSTGPSRELDASEVAAPAGDAE